MSDKVEVDPTPIQRNTLDVAMELTELYWKHSNEADIEKLDAIFARFYAMAKTLHSQHYEKLSRFLSDDIKS